MITGEEVKRWWKIALMLVWLVCAGIAALAIPFIIGYQAGKTDGYTQAYLELQRETAPVEAQGNSKTYNRDKTMATRDLTW